MKMGNEYIRKWRGGVQREESGQSDKELRWESPLGTLVGNKILMRQRGGEGQTREGKNQGRN